MDFWPGISKAPTKDTTLKKKKGKGNSREAERWTNYPIINHGGLSAATLVKVGSALEWKTVHSIRKGYLSAYEKPTKIFPMTRPKDVELEDITLRERAEHGARFLRTYHPDIDISSELIKEELDFNDRTAEQRVVFDPFDGNTVSATYCYESPRKRSALLVFPTGDLGRDLNVSPVNLRRDGLIFQPRARPLWTFDTPIRQIVPSASAIDFVQKKGCHIAVRTYGQISVFDIRNQITSLPDPLQSQSAITELAAIYSTELDGGKVIDLNFTAPGEVFLVTGQGSGYQCSLKSERKVIKRLFGSPSEVSDDFWRICGDNTAYGGIVTSTNLVRRFDTRLSASFSDLLIYNDGRHVITSFCPTQIDHLFCASTTDQVMWIDERFSKQPLLGWKHYRNFDRTLNVQSINFGETSLSLLSSYHNNCVSAIAVGKLDNGPLQCQMPSRAVPHTTSGCAVVGRTLIRHPSTSSDSLSLVELSDQGSLHHLQLRYSKDVQADIPTQGHNAPQFSFQWSSEVEELERKSKDLHPDLGKMSSKERSIADLSEIYQALFGGEAAQLRTEAEEKDAEGVYEILEKMPLFWQRADPEEEHLRTLFDVVFGSGDEPLNEARADFLTGSVLNSARGHRARKLNRIPADDVAKNAAWSGNIQEILRRIAPDVSKDAPINAEELDPYHVIREEEFPEADRRESEAREQLALDLALSAHVYSATAIKSAAQWKATASSVASPSGSNSQEPAALLTQAAEKLSLSQNEPPSVAFGYHRPVVKDGKKYYKQFGVASKAETQAAEEDKEAEMPLGVRLLLSEWNVGDDPYEFEYMDPYNLENAEAGSQLPLHNQSQTRRRRQQRGSPEDVAGGVPLATQSQAPPTIVAAKSLATIQSKAVGGYTQPSLAHRAALRTQTHIQNQFAGFSQAETEPASSQPMMMANTQVEPGPFGGRPGVAKKKTSKKRVGGF
ncbi:hypothetical protein DFH11DRAFT_1577909 [Phellopilus nigrolimitatus]|nr:hypothetical protein DFH11DRAFT_1577909 [Phellopilus nigrolimitatus]